ncbi:MAG: hypothetical protein HUK20_00065 [Fibrobacter sp.]|nr:hypothetical protein [Fibrobacter sp.]
MNFRKGITLFLFFLSAISFCACNEEQGKTAEKINTVEKQTPETPKESIDKAPREVAPVEPTTATIVDSAVIMDTAAIKDTAKIDDAERVPVEWVLNHQDLPDENWPMNWGSAIYGCPEGTRLPTADEFRQSPDILKMLSKVNASYEEKKRNGAKATSGESYDDYDNTAMGKQGFWWTIQLVSMGVDTIAPTAVAVQIKNDSAYTVELDVSERLLLKCVKKTDADKFTFPVEQTIRKINGIIGSVQLEPHYEYDGCGECCCEEGSGAYLTVKIQTDKGLQDSIVVSELDHNYCGVLEFDENGNPKRFQTENCEPVKMENFKMLHLLQPGAIIKYTSCTSPFYIISNDGNERIQKSCGETILVEQGGLVQNKREIIIQPEYESEQPQKLCEYTIKLDNEEKVVTARGPCRNVKLNQRYSILADIELPTLFNEKSSPVGAMEYPCCYGEDESHILKNISFNPLQE